VKELFFLDDMTLIRVRKLNNLKWLFKLQEAFKAALYLLRVDDGRRIDATKVLCGCIQRDK
jgi:hypothetical protein